MFEKITVDPPLFYDILQGLKALCDMKQKTKGLHFVGLGLLLPLGQVLNGSVDKNVVFSCKITKRLKRQNT